MCRIMLKCGEWQGNRYFATSSPTMDSSKHASSWTTPPGMTIDAESSHPVILTLDDDTNTASNLYKERNRKYIY